MNKIKIKYKKENELIQALLEDENIEQYKEKSLLKKLSLSKKDEKVDIYFHSGILDKESLEDIQHAKKVIISSKVLRDELIESYKIDKDKIKFIYPFIKVDTVRKRKEERKKFLEKYDIDKKRKIISFTGKNIIKSGVKEFITIINSISYKNIQAIILADEKQINALKFHISNPAILDKFIFISDKDELDTMLFASDVFLLPTYNRAFSNNILKAMYCKCAVFLSLDNFASEFIDTFSCMNSPNDASIIFKLDAVLNNEEDLKLIKKENKKIAKNFLFDKQLVKVYKIIENLNYN